MVALVVSVVTGFLTRQLVAARVARLAAAAVSTRMLYRSSFRVWYETSHLSRPLVAAIPLSTCADDRGHGTARVLVGISGMLETLLS